MDFKAEVLDSDKVVLVDFWAKWCGPCRMFLPIIEAVAQEYADQIKLVKVDIEQEGNDAIAKQYGVVNIPTIMLFKNGQKASRNGLQG